MSCHVMLCHIKSNGKIKNAFKICVSIMLLFNFDGKEKRGNTNYCYFVKFYSFLSFYVFLILLTLQAVANVCFKLSKQK